MRLLSAAILVATLTALAAPPAAAADKNEEKAKEAAVAFLKAVKAKDLDAVMKTVDVPFLMEDQPEPLAKTDEVKAALKTLLEKVKPEKVPTDVGAVLDLPTVRKKVEKQKKNGAETIEKLIGKNGFVVVVTKDGKEQGAVLVRMKDGQAKVVGIAD